MRSGHMIRRAAALCLSLGARAAAEGPLPGGGRLEFGLDDRYHMLSPTATLIQQWFGFSAAAAWPVAGVPLWKGGRLELELGAETGLSFDATGICRYFVRRMEIDWINETATEPTAMPAFTADLLFSQPLYIPFRPRSELDLAVTPGWSIQLGCEVGLVFLWYLPGRPEIRMDAGLSLGTRVRVADGFSLGVRLRACSFGDIDQWPGFGLTLYGAWE